MECDLKYFNHNYKLSKFVSLKMSAFLVFYYIVVHLFTQSFHSCKNKHGLKMSKGLHFQVMESKHKALEVSIEKSTESCRKKTYELNKKGRQGLMCVRQSVLCPQRLKGWGNEQDLFGKTLEKRCYWMGLWWVCGIRPDKEVERSGELGLLWSNG